MQTALSRSASSASTASASRRAAAVRPFVQAPTPSGFKVASSSVVAKAAPPTAVTEVLLSPAEEQNLQARHRIVQESFPSALGVDDFMAKLETLLAGYGFTGDNSIAMTNLCRDEVTAVLKDKIEATFGASFNTNGLGAVITCGATGMGAGLSHSPTCMEGRERYVFFSFPHIAIDSRGKMGAISRPGRPGASCACGALLKCLGEFKKEGYECNCGTPGEHDAMDPEYSLLKQRLARRLSSEKANVESLDLPELTAVAERTITSDLEHLIEKAVDTKKADYAVVTGVQIHNWASDLETDIPSMEMVAPSKVYVCVNGVKSTLDLNKVPSLSPRQLMQLAAVHYPDVPLRTQGALQEIPKDFLMKEVGGIKGGKRVVDKSPRDSLAMA